VQIPIACSLTTAQANDRVGEWRGWRAADIDAVETGTGWVRLRLIDDDAAVARTASLARREKACCPFFGFSLDLDDAGRWWLRVSAPVGAQADLDDLLSIS
jgi:hypothetical protein